jgi:hypothetical protein
MYLIKVNWRFGTFYEEGKTYDLNAAKIPQETIDAAVADGYLEAVTPPTPVVPATPGAKK